jgi:beta-phosphoglucomutase
VHVPNSFAYLIQQAGGLQRRIAGFHGKLKPVSGGFDVQFMEQRPTCRAGFALGITLCMRSVGDMKSTSDILRELSDRISTGTTILFDMDGTLVDTNYANYLSYRQAIQEVTHGELDIRLNPSRRFSREELKREMPNLSDLERNKIISLKSEYYKKYLPETKLNAVLADTLRKFNKTNVTVLVTNCQEDRAVMTLQYHGLLGCFSHMFFRGIDDVTDKYKNAMTRLGVCTGSVLVFEDEIADVDNAVLAGVPRVNIIRV